MSDWHLVLLGVIAVAVAVNVGFATTRNGIARWKANRENRQNRETFDGKVEAVPMSRVPARTVDRMLDCAEKLAGAEGSHVIIVRMFAGGTVSAHEAMPEGGTKMLTEDGLTLEITPAAAGSTKEKNDDD